MQAGRVLISLPSPYGEKLAEAVSQIGWEGQVVSRPFTPDSSAQAAVVDHPDAAQIAVAAGIGAVAVIGAAAPPGAQALTGSLPRPVLEWLQSLEPAGGVDWDDEAAGNLAWDDTAPAAPMQPLSRQRSIAVYSSGGGVGKSTTSVALATLAAKHNLNTSLVELDEDRRGILTYFDKTVAMGLDSMTVLDWQDPERAGLKLAQIRTRVDPHLVVFPMKGTPEGFQCWSEENHHLLSTLFDYMDRHFNVTVYDLPARLRDVAVMQTLEHVEHIILVLEPNEITLESMTSYITMLEKLRGSGQAIVSKMKVVVNKVPRQRRAALPSTQIADSLRLPLLGEIPHDPDRYLRSINQHRFDVDPAWERVFEGLELRPALAAGIERSKRRAGSFWFWGRRARAR